MYQPDGNQSGQNARGQFSITQADARSEYAALALASDYRFRKATRDVDVQGHRARLTDSTTSARLEVVIGTTWVIIHAESADLASRVAKALQKLS
jgi:hypothetical protein